MNGTWYPPERAGRLLNWAEKNSRIKGRPHSQEYSHKHIMHSVWLDNYLQCQDHGACPAELLEFSAAASVVTGLWLFLLPPQCPRGFVNYQLVQKCRLGQADLTGRAEIPFRLSHMPVSELPRAYENRDLALSVSEERLHQISQNDRLPNHRKTIS